MFGGLELIAILVLFLLVWGQRKRTAALEEQLRALTERLASSSDLPVKPEAAAVDTATGPVLEAALSEKPETEATTPVLVSGDGVPDIAAPAAEEEDSNSIAALPEKKRDIETSLGTRWAVWVGGLALALGGLFLVRYSIEAGIFGPGARLVLAAAFGLLLLAGGEFIRRTGYSLPLHGIANAHIPAILTGAGAFSLFGVAYAAHAVYGFIGPVAAFTLLAVVALATIGLAIVHGQALAGLGLLGALATPMLVATRSPNAWTLFAYLAIVLAATGAVARLRLWNLLMAAAFGGVGAWNILYMANDQGMDANVVLFTGLAMLAVLAFIWFWRSAAHKAAYDSPTLAAGLFVGVSAFALMTSELFDTGRQSIQATALVVAMLALAIWKLRALALLFSAAGVTAGSYGALGIAYGVAPILGFSAAGPFDVSNGNPTWSALALSALFLAVGAWMARRHASAGWRRATSWIACGGAVALIVVASLWVAVGDLDRDPVFAVVALFLTCFLAACGEWIARAEKPALAGGPAVSAALAAAGLAALLAVHAGFGPGLATVLTGALAVPPALAVRWRSYRVLGWLCVGAAIATLGRVAYDPTIVGSSFLQATPVLNWLLPGYGVPALSFVFAAWRLRATSDRRPQMVMEAAAALFAVLTIAMLVRHAMHDGVIGTGPVTLAEQAIYTLIALGTGAILLALDQRSPSSVLRLGSIAAGVVSAILIALQHFVVLNPLLTDESTGSVAVFNLLLLAYLLPAAAFGGLALYARGKRPAWYVQMLALGAALLAFAYATLSVRRVFKGEFIASWRGFDQTEMYSYSALWLVLGVVLLTAGVRLNSQALRFASAALIVVAVLKVFLLDMSALEGVLRALSFIGLGAVLIGIGLFYQRLLLKQSRLSGSNSA